MKLVNCGYLLFSLFLCVTANQSTTNRLPTNTKPQRYDITLITNIDRNEFDFTGIVKINLRVEENSNVITLNARQLTVNTVNLVTENGLTVKLNSVNFNPTTEILSISTQPILNKGSNYVLTIEYSGKLQTETDGFHRKSFVSANGKTRWLATKPSESNGARNAFPCYDEPDFSAHFTIHIEHGRSYRAISNTKGTRNEIGNGRVITDFEQTPKMSTHSLAFIVSNFDYDDDKSATRISSRSSNKVKDLMLDIDSVVSVEELNGRNNRPMDYSIRRNSNATISDPRNIPTYGPSITSYFSSNSADLIYVEQMVPSEGKKDHIYWSACNFYFGRRGGYAGIQHQVNKIVKGISFKNNNICSIWDEKDIDPHLPTESTLTYGAKGLHWNHFGGEGTGLHTSHPIDWSTDQWYSTVIRRWYIAGENVTRMAMFMYSYSDQKWTHYMSAAVPGIDIPITGNSITGFLERFTGKAMGHHGIYGQHYRMNTNGSWEKPLYYKAEAGGNPNFWKAELDQMINIKLTAGGIFDNTESHIKLHPKEADPKPKPVISPHVEFVNAYYINVNNFAVSVEWKISSKTPPQLSYDIQICKGDRKGELIAKTSSVSPEKRKETLDTGALTSGKYFAIVEFHDIFNQKSNTLHAEFIVL